MVDLKLGDESIELLQFSGTRCADPADSRSNDLSFQHVAIIVSDMDEAYSVLRQNQVEHISPYPQTLPDWNQNAAGIKAFYFRDPDGHPLEILQFPPTRAIQSGNDQRTSSFWESTTPRSSSRDTDASKVSTACCSACRSPARATTTELSRST